jgi:predicted DCC family thiol-disulfide oxidoreductase YuxK
MTAARSTPAEREHPIVFFDGVCGLCNTAVDWILRVDRGAIFRFSPLQGEAAKRLSEIPRGKGGDLGTVVVLDEGREYRKSDAVMRVLWRLGGVYRVLAWLRVVPRFLRDAVYDGIARVRYRVFGKRDACRVPTAEERGRFLE